MPLFNNILAGAAGQTGGDAGYKIERSLRFNSADSAYLNRTPSSAGNRKTWTWSCWIKRNNLGSAQNIFLGSDNPTKNNTTFSSFYFHPNNKIYFGGWNSNYIITDAVYRDLAWYHIVLSVDTTQSTPTDRIKLYVNNVLQFYSTGTGFPGQDTDLGINQTYPHYIGGNDLASGYASHMYADVHFIDGQALAPTAFGEFDADTGVWNPIKFTGSHNAASSGVVYSAGVSSPQGIQSSNPATNAFDGSTSTLCTSNTTTGNPELTVTFNPPLTNVTSLRMYTGNIGSNQYATGYGLVNGTSISHSTLGASYSVGWVDFTGHFSGTTVNSIGLGQTNASNYTLSLSINAIEVNGTILTDGIGPGVNGFHLDFSDGSSLGKDSAGSNDWTANNLVGELGSRQGYKGGNSYPYSAGNSGGGGGGGAGAPGGNAVSGVTAGAGGAGRTSTITGSSVTYGGGGGGGSWGTAGGAGGAGGGGAGKLGGTSTGAANPGTDGLGGGGGGAGYSNADWQNGGAGGSGRVIIRYPSSYGALTAAHSGAQTTVGSDYVYQWTTVNTGTITFPGSSSIDVQYLVLGGGGGAEAGGGGGGGVLEGTLTVTGGTNHTVTVGAGGTAPAYPSAANNGASSTFSNITALGGGRGGGGDSSAFPTDGGSGGGGGTQGNNNAGGSGVPGPASDLDVLFDSPTNGTRSDGEIVGNYATLNPLDTKLVHSNGNLNATSSSSQTWVTGRATVGMPSGKFYWEATVNTLSHTDQNTIQLGISALDAALPANDAYQDSNSWVYVNHGQQKANGGSASSYGAQYLAGDTVGVAFDADNGTLAFYVNGVSQGNAYTNLDTSKTYAPVITLGRGGTGTSISTNFGQQPWAHTPPAGYLGLCTTNLPEPDIRDPSEHFAATLYTGSGGSQTITTGHSNDLVWVKRRSSSSSHLLVDTVRGHSKGLYSDLTLAEQNDSSINAFTSDGFTVNGVAYNDPGQALVAWTWDGGDLVTNSAYNQSDVWSSRCTGTIYNASLGYENAFDGSTSTGSHPSNGNTITFTPATAIPVSSSIKIYYDIGSVTGTSGSADITINGTSYVATAHSNRSNGHFTVTGVSSITSMVWERAADNDLIAVKAIEVDGKVLVDAGLIPAGSLNSSVYNTSSNWSVAQGSGMQNNWDASFDGDLSDFALPVTGSSASMTFSSAISYTTLELVVSRDLYAPDLLMNGSTLNVPITDSSANGGAYKIERLTFSNGTLTSIGHNTRNTAGRGGSGFWQIIVDGKILVDSNQTPPNVPSIASTCRANQTAGQSIVSFSGSGSNGDVGHGLLQAPELVITKSRGTTGSWRVFTDIDGTYKIGNLNNTDAFTNASVSAPTSSVFNVDGNSNTSTTHVAYCFHSVDQFSKIGFYEGNGASGWPNADGTYVHLGFRPKFILFKNIDASENWIIYDSEREPFNFVNNKLLPNSNAQETENNNHEVDFLSNGFKLRGNTGELNASNQTYVYYAVAETPGKYSRAR
nr:fiber protein [uncultured Mediterranean phage uvMED]